MTQSGIGAARETDVAALSSGQSLDFDDDTLKAMAEVYKAEGNEAYLKEDYSNAIYFYTEGIKVNCKDQDLKAKLYSNRAYANLRFGNCINSLKDAKEATDMRPLSVKPIIAGNSKGFIFSLRNKQKFFRDILASSCGEGKRKQEQPDSTSRVKDFWCNYHFGMKALKGGDYKTARYYFELALKEAREIGNKDSKGTAYNNLGNAYHDLGDLQKAIECFQLSLSIAEKTGNKNSEETAYNNLGDAYRRLGDLQKAIECFQLSLSIAEKTGNKNSEGRAYNNLGLVYHDLGDLQKAIECFQLSLSIAEKTGNKNSEKTAYDNLGDAYRHLGDLQKAIECFQLSLSIAEKTGNKNSEETAYKNLGNELHINLGLVYHDCQKAIEFFKLSLSIAEKTGNKNSEGAAYNNLGLVYTTISNLGDLEKAMECFQLSLSIAKTSGRKNCEGAAYNNLGLVYDDLGDLQKAFELTQLSVSIAEKTGNKDSKIIRKSNLASIFFRFGDVIKAEECAKSSIKLVEEMRDLLPGKDEWKINFRNERDNSYTLLRRIQSQQGRTLEALFTAEAGRAQALMDLMESRYCVRESIRPSSEQQMELIMTISGLVSSPTIFVAEDEKLVSLWLLLKGQQCHFIQKKISVDLKSLIRETYQKIGVNFDVRGKDRSRDEPEDEESVALKTLHDVVIAPFSHLIKSDEIIIVPDRSSFLIPYVALVDQNSRYLSETMRIRLAPSLRSLRLLAECPEDNHSTSGALLVGNPWVETVRIKGSKFKPLPGAEKEVQMIGQILNIQPLTGRNATKDQVLSRLNSVSLVHIAAHGCPENGEIILSPNLADAKKPEEEDFRLTMRDVLDAQLRAKLVVLSCCFSARGEIKAEGVVGIARAFLGAGARSVIASLWALSDDDTLEFMRHFYRNLVAGQSASKSLHHAMECMRETQEFNAVKYWAPFVLIGDDVTMNFD
ncbi:unnamed protein product [Porites lobata]|uniref:CHAT domain-containing protein n=1 Tax=Porites lobata TaxID=104759 RepID=A0ABN8MXU6_9CNID|nr:unnamed protein product [Porites lobata]